MLKYYVNVKGTLEDKTKNSQIYLLNLYQFSFQKLVTGQINCYLNQKVNTSKLG